MKFHLFHLFHLLVPSCLLLSALAFAAGLELASPFVDRAILQRDMKVPVWGWGAPGSKVTVTFAGQEQQTTTAQDGTWRVDLKPLTASTEPRPLVVTDAAGAAITCNEVLVGEVWLASGQSNMDWLAGKSNCGKLASEVAKARLPIREYVVDTGSSLFTVSRADCADGWKGPEKAGGFSALALSFAAELQRELGVPVGIIRASHGATPVETWTAYEGFAAQPDLQHIARLIEESDPGTPAGMAAFERYHADLTAWQAEAAKAADAGASIPRRPNLPGIASDWKGASRMHNKKVAPLIPYAIRGVIWCQGEHNSGDGRIYASKMEALLKGWRILWDRPTLPLYFTQLQCYGTPGPDHVGFADAREAQALFYQNNKHVGMVVQTDLNPARPEGIHPSNKLDPGKRLARWALAHDYGRKDLAFTGPAYQSHSVAGGKVRVKFTQRGPGGVLMVGSKGMEADQAKPDGFVEPARETPGAPLQHFRLAGKDGVWHPAQAVIDGGEVVVSSAQVAEPVGVQYAYNNSPIGSNLYNRAGLPAAPFIIFDGKTLFQEDLQKPAEPTAKAAPATTPLSTAAFMRNGMILQRGQNVPLWGFGAPGSEVTVLFAGQEKSTTVNANEEWSLQLDAMPPSTTGRDLEIRSSNGRKITVRDVLVGDVWFVTGGTELTSATLDSKSAAPAPTEALAHAREFVIKTKSRRFPTPRKRDMEVGGGRFRSSWTPIDPGTPDAALTVFGYHFAKAAQEPGIPIGILTFGAENPPLTWISHKGMQSATGFEKERDEINLAFPNTDAFRKALGEYQTQLKSWVAQIATLRQANQEIPAERADATPPFPAPAYNEWVSYTETATHTYNFCISPNTPCAVRGVVWMPFAKNLGSDHSRYTQAVAAYAQSLPEAYGQPKVPFVFAHPAASLLGDASEPLAIPHAARVDFSEWPKSPAELAVQLGAAAAELK
jgi:hypothetical protein